MLNEILATHLSAEIPELDAQQIIDQLSTPPDPTLGVLSFSCFALAKLRQVSPGKIAEILSKIPPPIPFCAVKAVGPYLNFDIDTAAVASELLPQVERQGSSFGSSTLGGDQPIVIDYSSPNIAKHLGVHHLRSTIIGSALCNIHEKCGYRVVGVNYLGDWGTQFGHLITAYQMWHTDEPLTVDYLADLYVRFHHEMKNSPDLQNMGRQAFKKLENGDAESMSLWSQFRSVSLREFSNIYDRLGVSFTVFDAESNYVEGAKEVVEMALSAKVAHESNGAIVVDYENNPPCILQKSDGATTYLARDIAAAIYRNKFFGAEKLLYVVGAAQELHFQQLQHTLDMLGYKIVCQQVPFGLLQVEGQKLSTRQGNVVLLKDVLDAAKTHTQQIVASKNNQVDESSIDAIATGAVIFADLSTNRIKNLSFKWEHILNFDGNTGPYLQYTLARCLSICRRAGSEPGDLSLIKLPEEKVLLVHIANFGRTILDALKYYDPSIIINYLISFSRDLNRYLHNIRIIQDNTTLQQARASLLRSSSYVLEEGLRLMNITAVDKM